MTMIERYETEQGFASRYRQEKQCSVFEAKAEARKQVLLRELDNVEGFEELKRLIARLINNN